MPQRIEVPGMGIVEFPDGMSDEQIAAAIRRNMQPQVTAQSLRASTPAEYDPSSAEFQAKYGATAGIPAWQRAAAGAGKFLYDAARGVGQITGLQSQESIDEAKRRDAPLMATTAGKAGNLLGGAVFSAPAMFIPGANTATGAALTGAAVGAVQPVATGESRTANTAFGAGGGLAGYGIGRMLSRAAGVRPQGTAGSTASNAADVNIGPSQAGAAADVTGSVNVTGKGGYTFGEVGPDPSAGINDATRKILDTGRGLGMQTTPGRATGSRMLQQMEAKLAAQPMTGGRFAAIDANNEAVLTRLAARAVGDNNADALTADVIDNSFARLGKVFEDAGDDAVRGVSPDDFLQRLSSIESEYSYLLAGNKSIADTPIVRDFFEVVAKGSPTGRQLANISSKLGNAIRTEMIGKSGDRNLGMALGDVKEYVDELLVQGMTKAKADKFMQARGQYRTLLTLVNNAGVTDPVTGRVSGPTLANVLQRTDRTGFTRGRNVSDLYQAARFSRAFRDPIGNSGTATRMPLNTAEMVASIPLNIAARAYTSTPAVNAALRTQAAAQAAAPFVQPLLAPISPYAQYMLPGAGGLFGTYAAR